MAQCRWGMFVLASLLVTGCSSEPQGGPRLKTYPVTGAIHVNGEPTMGVMVNFIPQDDSSQIKFTISAISLEAGKFQVTTYVSGDGLPEGNYKLTFKLDGPDNSSEYTDPATSKFDLVVGKDKKSIDMGVIDLAIKDRKSNSSTPESDREPEFTLTTQ